MEVSGKKSISLGSEKCQPCIIEGIYNEPTGFCTECEEFMCNECFNHHLKSKFCRNHVLAPVGQEQPELEEETSVTELSEYCAKHNNQPLRYYCRQHDTVSCGDCLVAEHHGCHIKFVKDLAKNFKESPEFKDMIEEIQQLDYEKEECLEQNQTKMEENVTLMEKSLREIKEFLHELGKTLENDGKEIEKKVNKLSKDNENNLAEIKEEITRVDQKSAEISRTLDLYMHNDVALFIRHVEFKPVLNELKNSVAGIKGRNQIVSYAFQPEIWLKDLLETHLTLGTLTVSGKEQAKSDLYDATVVKRLSSNEKRENNEVTSMTKKAEQIQISDSTAAQLINSSGESRDDSETSSVTKTAKQLIQETELNATSFGSSKICQQKGKSSNTCFFVQVDGENDEKNETPTDLLQPNEGLSRRGLIVSLGSSVMLCPKRSFWKSYVLKGKDIELGRKIGEGRNTRVYVGEYKQKKMTVAVKVCKEELSAEQRKLLLLEGSIFQQYQHPNIENFIGIVVQNASVMVVMEYVLGGNLWQYLRAYGQEQSRPRATQICLDIASGMEYLAENGCIHTDLRAHNCLIGDKLVAKISALGMATGKEVTLQSGFKIPFKWTDPEAWTNKKLTTASDVWSFGVLMWEVFSNGQQPYPGWDMIVTKKNVERGYRLFAPPDTPENIYLLMLKCWYSDQRTRITFGDLRKRLTEIVSKPPAKIDKSESEGDAFKADTSEC